MPTAGEQQLLRFLNVQEPVATSRATATRRAAITAGPGPPPPRFDAQTIAALRARLLALPEEMLANAPAFLGDAPELEDGLKLLNDAEPALRTPRHTLAALAANRSDEAYQLFLPVRRGLSGDWDRYGLLRERPVSRREPQAVAA
jgi:hypothetical protein